MQSNSEIDVVIFGATGFTGQLIVEYMQVDQAGTQVFRSSFVFDRRYALLVRGRF